MFSICTFCRFLGETAAISPIRRMVRHLDLSVMCHITCTVLKLMDGFWCCLASTLAASDDTLCSMGYLYLPAYGTRGSSKAPIGDFAIFIE